jgi:hypothetical protein
MELEDAPTTDAAAQLEPDAPTTDAAHEEPEQAVASFFVEADEVAAATSTPLRLSL